MRRKKKYIKGKLREKNKREIKRKVRIIGKVSDARKMESPKTKNLAIEFLSVVLCCHGDLLLTSLFDSFAVSFLFRSGRDG